MSPRAGFFGSARVASGGGGITGTYVSTNGSTANVTSYTFTAQAIGTASATRRVVVAIAGRDTTAYPSSVTVGGISLTMDAGNQSTQVASLWSAVVPTGTTADIVVNYAVANTYCGIGVWALSGGSASGFVATASNTANPALSVTTQAGDFVIACLAYRVTVTGPSVAWNAASERYDAAVDGSVRQHAGADLVASGASADMGATITNYTSDMSGIAAGYR